MKGNYQNLGNGKLEVNLHDEIISRKDMQSSYLDKFDVSIINLPKVSAIVPTYNRAPHTPEEDANPLGWCLESLLAQKGGFLDEIIVMDDASTDYTEEVVKDFQKKSSNVDIRYFKNEKNLGSSKNKNNAVAKSKNDQIIFLDDDCIFSNYFIFGANYTFNSLPKNKGALHMPVYHRRLTPFPVKDKEIGILDFENGVMTGNHGGFPESYSKNLDENFLDENLKVVKPLKISNLAGIFMMSKKLFQEVGGYPEFYTWKNGYREEAYVSVNLIDKGHDLYFTPDPKFYSVHLKYGSKGKDDEIRNANPTLRRLISYSSFERGNTGNRVDPEEWFFDRIISTYVTLGRKNPSAANKYLKKTEEEFVKNNQLSVSGFGTKINDYSKRKSIFENAIEKGRELIYKVGN